MRVVVRSRTGAAVALVLAAAALVPTAKILGHWHYDPTLWALAGWIVPPDFGDFYVAAEAVLKGDNPYRVDVSGGWLGFVYPPLLAWLLTPLTLLSVPTAVSVWAVLTVFFVVAALRVLDVRDWRCYPLALLSPFARETVEFGAVDALLMFVVALTWRYRDAPLRAAAASGFAVAIKLFLWPLALWFGLSGRLRTALLSCMATATFVLVPWALIGFQGIDSYRGLLSDVANQQGGSYSLASLAEELDFAATFARAVSVAVGACLLFLSFRAAHASGVGERVRSRRSFTLAIAAALALTPVVWNHYLLLLFVPVAMARPRLSGMWFLPFAANSLYVFDWYGPKPAGLPPRIAIAALTAATIVLAIEAQARPRSNAVRPVLARARQFRFWRFVAAGVAAASVLVAIFVAAPEKLNDRPYNPLGRDTSEIDLSKPAAAQTRALASVSPDAHHMVTRSFPGRPSLMAP
jgi:alpha-1,2-mannosyltransferase